MSGAAGKERELVEAFAGMLHRRRNFPELRAWSDHLRYRFAEVGSRSSANGLLGAVLRPFALDYLCDLLEPLLQARRSLLGDAALGPARLLVRVDEFPHYLSAGHDRRFGSERFAEFHAVMRSAGVPYALAVLPRVAHEPLCSRPLGSRPLEHAEVELLGQLKSEGVELALHGRDHRTRNASPHHHSELSGLDRAATEQLLDEAMAELEQHSISPRVFVAPFNRFDAAQLELLGRRFAVVCGGPESIRQLGFQPTPQWRSCCIYLPSYAPFYGAAEQMLSAVSTLIAREPGIWVPLVLHWEWEQGDDWSSLRRLVDLIAPFAVPWSQLLDAAERVGWAPGGGSLAGERDGGDPR
ncbi:MAG TPA: DUF2334 domain-containing protein [Solirubrobacteraceae bacterium]|nr:DUF2334 domain-containing protein [Solirubrobacteraceae bacterium]